MHQFACKLTRSATRERMTDTVASKIVWTLLEAEGLGCNLQHYSPLIDARVSQEWSIPIDWSLKAQLVFGQPTGPGPREKAFEPLDKRVLVYGR